jgi:[ribosomal protein S18]-alanine N-acetyltransferase
MFGRLRIFRMSRKVFLRGYRNADLDAMFRLDEGCFAREFRFDRQSMQKFAEYPNAVVRIAEDNNRGIVGFVIAHVEAVASERTAYVVTLDVAPDWRRSGLGRRLMQDMESRVAVQGARRSQLHVFSGNEPAIRFYENLRYQRIRLIPGYYGEDLSAIVYAKELLRG